MPEDFGNAGVAYPAARAERIGERGHSLVPVPDTEINTGSIRRSIVPTGGKKRSIRSLFQRAREVSSSFAAAIRDEQLYGHGFLFLPVMLGLGAAFWFLAPSEMPVWLWALVALTLGAGALWLSNGFARTALMVVCLIAAGMTLAGLETWRKSTVILDSPVTATIEGVVERGEMAGAGMRYLVTLTSTSDPTLRRPPRQVSLVARSRHTPFTNGAVMTGRVRLSPPSGPALPGLHDFALAAYFDGIGAVGHFYGAPQPVAREKTEPGLITRAERWLFALRTQIGDRIRATAPGDGGAFAAAIVTDERRAISAATVEALRVSGLAHIVAISGLNMALAAGICFVGLRMLLALFPATAQALPVKKIAACGALAMVTGYYLISGFGVSAQRAYIMMAVILVAVLLDRPSISLRNVALSALVIIIWTPSEILGASFQMSFAATVALVAGYAAWARRAQRLQREPFPFRHPLVTFAGASWNFLVGTILTSLIGSLATAMFSIEHFHRIATYGLAANLAAMPIISFLVMPAGLAAMLLMPFGLDAPFIGIMAASLDWVIAIAVRVAGWGGDIVIGQQHGWFLPLGVTGLLLLTLLRTRLRIAGLPFLAAAFFLFLTYNAPRSSLLVSEDGTLVGITKGDEVAINRERPPAFIYNQWKRARLLPEPLGPILVGEALEPSGRPAADARLPSEVVANARRRMKEAGELGFTCEPRAWCAMRSPEGILVAAVEDGRYAGAACDVADLVIAPRARFDGCRSGAPLLNGAMLRKTGAMEIDFAGFEASENWHIKSAMTGTARPWSIHRQYDWRRNLYDPALPPWLVRAPRKDASPPAIAEGRSGSTGPESGREAEPNMEGGEAGFSDNGE